MKSLLLAVTAVALALPLSTMAGEPAHKSHQSHEAHGSAGHAKLERNAGKKWATDAPLRTGMDAIRKSMATALPVVHAGKYTPDQYQALGKQVNEQLGYIVQNCKLEPKADAQLHFVINDISKGVEHLERGSGEERAAGAVKITQALNQYGQYFDHPGWKSVKLPH